MLGPIRFLLALVSCRHPHTYRERKGKTLVLVCERCGKGFPVALSEPKKAKRLKARLARSKASVVTVVPFQTRQAGR